jgi:uncharacterized membrane protein (UPF0182 family)
MQHLRYPEDLFKVQRYQFARYHVKEAHDFYQGNNRWEVPQDPEAPSKYQPPYRMFVQQPGESGESFELTSVFVPRGKNNLASFVSVNSDATSDHYGEMRVLQLPNEQTPGPGLIANEMTTSENVRNELLAFQSGGSKPIYGNLLTLPVEDGLMYVQPVYATRELSDASFPELEFVIVSYGGQVGIGATMTEALADVLGVNPDISTPTTDTGGNGGTGGSNQPTGDADAQIRELLARAQVAFDQADAALADRDLDTYAKKVEEARKLVERAVGLSEQARQPASPGPGNTRSGG